MPPGAETYRPDISRTNAELGTAFAYVECGGQVAIEPLDGEALRTAAGYGRVSGAMPESVPLRHRRMTGDCS